MSILLKKKKALFSEYILYDTDSFSVWNGKYFGSHYANRQRGGEGNGNPL